MVSISPYLREVSESRYLSNARSCLSVWRSKFDFFIYMSISFSIRMSEFFKDCIKSLYFPDCIVESWCIINIEFLLMCLTSPEIVSKVAALAQIPSTYV